MTHYLKTKIKEIKENDTFLMTVFESGSFCIEVKKEDYTIDDFRLFVDSI